MFFLIQIMLAILSVHFKVALHYAPSFLAFLKFRGLWRLLECSSALRSGDSISNRKFFSDMKEGGRVGESYLSLPSLSLAIPPLDSAQKHLIVTAAATATTHSAAATQHTVRAAWLFHIFRLELPGGSKPIPPLQYSSDSQSPQTLIRKFKICLNLSMIILKNWL